MKHDYKLGAIDHIGIWTDLRTALGNLYGGCLTPTVTSAGEDGWIVAVRSTQKLTSTQALTLAGYFNGFMDARNSQVAR